MTRDGQLLRYAFGTSSLAALLVARSETGIAAIIIREHLEREPMLAELRRRFRGWELVEGQGGMRADVEAVAGFVDAPRANIALPLDIHTTPFQRSVYEAVLKVPFGETVTFSDIARRIGRPTAMRAVGSACTRNPLEFAIPCHRVLRTDGKWAGGGDWGDYRQSQIVGREREAARK
ncbi:MAG: 6-O-methylguanine methyltransferase [Bradyrhizobium sp.]|nr:6-O-methylguanine methyltransferase [Bradyrhizobium sp.]